MNLENISYNYKITSDLFLSENQIIGYYRVYQFLGECYIIGGDVCLNFNKILFNNSTDVFLVHNEMYDLSKSIFIESLCNRSFPNKFM